ncbi:MULTISPECIES: transporter substrate-binding domain-containing protein [Raoultella]|uniref:transporter substrate-binding domain-containing protein n=1 Tax=Raoultella TaxID=160674 RepID=UPI001F5083F2|nr:MULTISPECIES: transporter substrate-binding domain-containing protein [Raoultella]MCI1031442.1 transporter substrate-binding domain-containing protein [Raoultella terrigena]
MFKFLKAGVLALASVGLIALLSGPAMAQESSKLDKVISSKSLRVGIILSLPPFGMKNAEGEPEGFDVDVAKLAAQKLGVKLEIVDTTASDRIPNLRTDKVDMVIGQFTRNSERAKVVSFSDPYITAVVMAIAVPKDSTVSGAKDLSGKRVAVIKGTTQDAVFTATVPNADIQRFDSSAAALLALKQGQVDAMIEDGNFLNYQAKMDGKIKVVIDSAFKNLVDYNSIGVKRGDPDWLAWVNTFVFELNTSGKGHELYRKWFNSDMPAPLNPQI